MTQKGIWLLFLLCIAVTLQARQQGGSITGQVGDSISRKPLEFATVVLMQAGDRKTVAHALTDGKGDFQFTGIAFGHYQIGITMLGYAPRIVDSLQVDAAHLYHRLSPRYLSPTTQQLSGVTVAGKKPLIELQDEKLIYNVENDIDKDNSSASDIMRKIPMVTVDADGTIKLKGQTNYKVLLNGRATSIITRDPKEALKAYPASIIKKIEIITEPSAKYDAEGIGGIINIITQRQVIGYNGSLYANYNTIGRFSGGGTISARQKKVGVSAYAGGNGDQTKNSSTISRESFIPGNRGLLEQNTDTRRNNKMFYGSLELTYDMDSSNALTIFGNGSLNNMTQRMPQTSFWYDSTNKPIQSATNSSDSYNKGHGFGAGLDFQHKFKQPGHELSVAFNYVNGYGDGYTDNSQHYVPGTDSFYRNNNLFTSRNINVQADYTLPLPHEQRLETGFKGTFLHNESSATQEVRKEGNMVPNPSRDNIFNTQQNILAFYITYRFKIGSKLSIKPGFRLEQTQQTGDFISTHTRIKSDYTSPIPTVNITWQLQQMTSLSLSYSRRLQRPNIFSLNPYVNDNDPYNIFYGNPHLKPSYANSFGLYFNKIMEKVTFNAGADYTFTNDAIQNILTVDSTKGITSTTYDNIGKSSAVGLSASMRFALTKKWNVSINGRGNYSDFSNGSNLHSSGLSGSAYFNTDYNFGHDFRTDAYCYYYSGSPSVQGSSGSNIGYGFTLRKDFLNKKLSASLSADQPFRKQRPMVSDVTDPSFHRVSTYYFPANSYTISVSWRFGKLTTSATRNKSVVDTGM
ncbi:outer membrane beta-barrel family protein [Chitinophaga qingshengii]|uniref:TonB-dependent receptor n=1 Tax=Chitinophaga qingshengii TaxID=1569794 RepID=A0ABR7TV88_9BACT|nr:outer membrane beta-barrel family protein [Chitinophaga qingshengii]MBC9934373.1 TonB-dependent receptor [Chitinophaga qingshengii]